MLLSTQPHASPPAIANYPSPLAPALALFTAASFAPSLPAPSIHPPPARCRFTLSIAILPLLSLQPTVQPLSLQLAIISVSIFQVLNSDIRPRSNPCSSSRPRLGCAGRNTIARHPLIRSLLEKKLQIRRMPTFHHLDQAICNENKPSAAKGRSVKKSVSTCSR